MVRTLLRIIPIVIIIILGFFLWRNFKKMFSMFDAEPEVITINHTTILREIESIGKLELVKYHFKDVIEFQKEDYSWLPSSKVVLIAGGEAVGCIDLKKLKEEDLQIVGDTLNIFLPAPELCYFKINHEKSKVYDLEYTYFQDKNLIDQAYKAAEKQLKKAALDMHILDKTKENAEIVLKPILEKLTQKKVFFVYTSQSVKLPPTKH